MTTFKITYIEREFRRYPDREVFCVYFTLDKKDTGAVDIPPYDLTDPTRTVEEVQAYILDATRREILTQTRARALESAVFGGLYQQTHLLVEEMSPSLDDVVVETCGRCQDRIVVFDAQGRCRRCGNGSEEERER